MKKVICIIVMLLLFGCKTKSLTVEKSTESSKENYLKHFDSLVQLSLKLQLEYQKKQRFISSSYVLKSIANFDSLGNTKPLIYKHYIDGKLAEEIYLEGGELNQLNEVQESHELEQKNESIVKIERVESDVGLILDTKTNISNLNKKAEAKGFQFRFYIWLFAIIIALVILYWMAKKFKLPDKLKTVLQPKGG